MNDSDILKILKELRLTEHEAKCFLSLLEKETLTVTEVSKIAGIPRANAYEALEKLLTKGFCISRPGKVKRYSASDPNDLREKIISELEETFKIELETLKRKRDELLDKKDTTLENMESLIEELTPLYINSRSNEIPLEYIEVLKDPLQVHNRFTQLFDDAKEEVVVFVRPPYSGKRQLDQQVEQQNKLMRKGLKVRGIYEIPPDEEGKRLVYDNIELVTKRGEESRVLGNLPIKMAIFDERIVLFALEDPVLRKTSLTSLVIEHQSLARTLKIVFNTLWNQAEDYHVLKNSI